MREMIYMSIAVRTCLGFFLIGSLAVGIPAMSQADDRDVDPQINAHLNAGEFPAARVMAQQMAPNMRDIALARVARAQWDAGARNGAANTVNGLLNPSGMAGPMFAGQAPGYGEPGTIGNQGGAGRVDFTQLIDLIKKTTGTPNPGWVDDGGVGTVEQYRNGVFVDADGLVRLMKATTNESVRSRDLIRATSGNRDVRKISTLRKISLNRLERELQLRRMLGEVPDASMKTLAGITKIQYLMVYPETGDIVLAGPAADWQVDAEGRTVNAETGRPVLQLDDLIVLLRNAFSNANGFGCTIDPREENLKQLQAFLTSSTRPLRPGERNSWVEKIRDLAGRQDIRVFGLDPRTRVAQVIVEADYRMKLIGMGLEEGTLGVKSYLDSVALDKNGKAPPTQVLRWWFTLNYDSIVASEEQDVFQLKGKGAKVLSENQMLTAQGKHVGTGVSDELNTQFAASFTAHFDELAAKYPVYAELQNVFDLAMVAALMKAHDMPNQVDWQMSFFRNAEHCPVTLSAAPQEVESIVNQRAIGKTIIAGVSGGVSAHPAETLANTKVKVDSYGALRSERAGSVPKNLHENAWWWD